MSEKGQIIYPKSSIEVFNQAYLDFYFHLNDKNFGKKTR